VHSNLCDGSRLSFHVGIQPFSSNCRFQSFARSSSASPSAADLRALHLTVYVMFE
jgi:hypothetical protein